MLWQNVALLPEKAFRQATMCPTQTTKPAVGVSLLSETLGTTVTLRLSSRGLRTIEHNGGLDAFLLSTPNGKLSCEAKRLKKRIKGAAEKMAAKA